MWICVSSLHAGGRKGGSCRRPSRDRPAIPSCRSGSPPAAPPRRSGSCRRRRVWRSATSSRIASAIWRHAALRGNVVADERPVEDGHRAREHRPSSACRVSDCAYCHHSTVIGCGRDTSPNRIGGRDVARAIGLNPAVLGEGEARQAARRNIAPCRCARTRHEQARPGRSFPASAPHVPSGFLLQEGLVGGIAQRALGVRGACVP